MKTQLTKRKIAIVGAGPAGISAALYLRDKGVKDITVFGPFEEAQLKTMTVDGVTMDVAACLHHAGYRKNLLPLAKRFGVNPEFLKGYGPSVSTSLKVLPDKFVDFIPMFFIMAYYSFFFMGWLFLHKTRFRVTYKVSFEEYLSKRGIAPIMKTIAMGSGVTAQGYGYFDEITAYHGMRWVTMGMMINPILATMNKAVGTLKEGFQTLFGRILNQFEHKPDLIQSVNIINENDANSPLKLTSVNGEEYIYDAVIIACPPKALEIPQLDFLQKEHVDTTNLFSILITTAQRPAVQNRGYVLDYIENKVKNKIVVFRYGGQTDKGEHLILGTGYKEVGTDDETLKSMLLEQIADEWKLDLRQIHFFKNFKYNLRFSPKALEDNIPQMFEKLQGSDNIWYSGGLMSHWDVCSILEHNRWLVNEMRYKYNNKNLKNCLGYQIRKVINRLRMI